MRKTKILAVLLICAFFLSGCAVVLQKGRRSDIEKIQSLERELEGLRKTKKVLEKKLAKEIADEQIRVDVEEKGLVITFVAEVLFDSGKANIRKESYPILDKVVAIIGEEVPDNDIGIEGHTDNVPIKYSGWKSNWELSAQRALSVLHYLEDKGISPEKLSAIGYGEYRPVASNDTDDGRQMNRRVEIVILPQAVKEKADVQMEEVIVYEEELK